jgi:HD superfamily phosphohydrolase
MLNVVNDQLVVEKKGIYSVEKFLIARRLMYWQVYFHKTVIASEYLLVKMLQRAKNLANAGVKIYASSPLHYFLYNNINSSNLNTSLDNTIEQFIRLDDSDVLVSAKEWIHSSDKVLSILSKNIINRKLPKVWISEQPQNKEFVEKIINRIQGLFKFDSNETEYFIHSGKISNSAFSGKEDMIQIMMSGSEIKDIAKVSDILNVPYLQQSEIKYFICFPKECGV